MVERGLDGVGLGDGFNWLGMSAGRWRVDGVILSICEALFIVKSLKKISI